MPLNQLVICLTVILFSVSCKAPIQNITEPVRMADKPKNIILMIGDGHGLSQISAALYSNKNQHALEQFPVIGFHKSYSNSDLITDSAAGATAFSCGVKTFNFAIGMDKDTAACKTILEEAEENGLATGLVVTSSIVHATPASFIAHQPLRVLYEKIAADFLNTEIDLFIGGGKRFFDRRQEDERNLYEELEQKDYVVVNYSQKDFNQVTINPNKNFAYFSADNQPLPVIAGREYLPSACSKSAEFLEKHSNGNGFFLMIEGSQIDWAGHANDAAHMLEEALDFNRAIEKILAFAKKRGDTLVIVTADHETGGLAINPKSKMGKLDLAFTTNTHTATLVPVFAYGPMSQQFAGIYENTEIYHKMRKAYGFETAASAGINE